MPVSNYEINRTWIDPMGVRTPQQLQLGREAQAVEEPMVAAES